MRRLYSLTALIGMLCIAGCSDRLTFEPKNKLVVVQGYLYTGMPISDIKITSTLGLGTQDTIAPPISDAQVQLIKDEVCYLLKPIFNKDGYYRFLERVYEEGDCPGGDCPDEELAVESGDVFKLEVYYYDKVATAELIVPQLPAGLSVSEETIFVSDSSYRGTRQYSMGGVFAEDTATALTIHWEDDGNSMYYLTMKTLEIFLHPIDPNYPSYWPGEFLSKTITGDHFSIGWSNITHYGTHRVRLYRLGEEYVEMFLTQNQDTRDLNEPLTNVRNGLGIFTALSSADIYFEVEPE
jgi:Domain of unknown function (DUF4249)